MMSPKDRQRHGGDTADISASEERYSHWGRPISWVAVSLMLVGFAVGGVGLTLGPPVWIVVVIGAVISVIGGVIAYSTDIFKDTGVTEEPVDYHDDSAEHGDHSLGEDEDRGGGRRLT
ncbi:hypothetical protein NI17_011475 [Thermobifida halotolerans]|uniref:Uncharacterized protein n=1 Tax=Thermobifida halotolerans TaxID=483545 RepID=A0A399G9D9_9ACTN|nr:hypothetical protein [Thermobifida halotolerans]UOE21658.1 hypothetical protein NI17_011475 [Thermobifida halotolerans]